MHTDEKIDQTTGKACKPEVITEYNLTKGEGDVVDKIEAEYSVTRFNNRWPFTIFCSFLNISTINSQIIHRENTNNIISRRKYITELSKSLVLPHLCRRSEITSLPHNLHLKMENIIGQKKTKT